MKLKLRVIALAAFIPLVMAGCTATGSTGSTGAEGSSYPKDCNTVKIIVGFSAGGTTDLTFRILADELSKELGSDVQVIDRPGGGGITGINQMLSAKADGCTLGHSSIPTHLQYLFPESPADYTKDDFSFAGSFLIGPQALVVASDSKFQSLDDLIEAGEGNGRLNAVADSPIGQDAIINAQFAEQAGLNVKQVVVDGSAEKVTALLSGQVDFANGSVGGIVSAVQSGQLRALAVWSDERSAVLPDVPTAKELGIDIVSSTYFALSLPAAVPEDIRQKLEDALKTISAKKSFIEANAELGSETAFLTGDEFSVVWDEMASTVEKLDFNSLG